MLWSSNVSSGGGLSHKLGLELGPLFINLLIVNLNYMLFNAIKLFDCV